MKDLQATDTHYGHVSVSCSLSSHMITGLSLFTSEENLSQHYNLSSITRVIR